LAAAILAQETDMAAAETTADMATETAAKAGKKKGFPIAAQAATADTPAGAARGTIPAVLGTGGADKGFFNIMVHNNIILTQALGDKIC
jgi:hypothetical protein